MGTETSVSNNHEDLNCISSTYIKQTRLGVVAHICHPSPGEVETGGFLLLAEQACLTYLANCSQKRKIQFQKMKKKWKTPEHWHPKLVSDLPPHLYACTYMWMNTQRKWQISMIESKEYETFLGFIYNVSSIWTYKSLLKLANIWQYL